MGGLATSRCGRCLVRWDRAGCAGRARTVLIDDKLAGSGGTVTVVEGFGLQGVLLLEVEFYRPLPEGSHMDMATPGRSVRRLVTGALILGALVIAGCGSNSSSTASTSSASSAPATPAPAASSSSASASSRYSSSASSGASSSGIPQGPTAGDRDSDNNGGPSDGDGNL